MFTDLIYSLSLWFPWLTFWSETFFFQVLILYSLYLLISSNNTYYTLLYMLVEVILFGILLSLYQLDFFTGFLWVVEFTIIFISLVLLFYLNIDGVNTKIELKNYKWNYLFGLIFLLLFLNFFFFLEYENYLPIVFNLTNFWEDYYEAIVNSNINDFMDLTIGYYSVNSFEYILIGLLLLIGSVVCVNLNKLQKVEKASETYNMFSHYNFFKDFINYNFLRKQNLMDQSNFYPSIRYFRKK